MGNKNYWQIKINLDRNKCALSLENHTLQEAIEMLNAIANYTLIHIISHKKLQGLTSKIFQKFNNQHTLIVDTKLFSKPSMKTLNFQYRQKNYPTNVLSFPQYSYFTDQLQSNGHNNANINGEAVTDIDTERAILLLGDIAICPQVLKAQAREQNKIFSNHFFHIWLHGFLHLLNFDHEEEIERIEMESLETAILQNFSIPNPYSI